MNYPTCQILRKPHGRKAKYYCTSNECWTWVSTHLFGLLDTKLNLQTFPHPSNDNLLIFQNHHKKKIEKVTDSYKFIMHGKYKVDISPVDVWITTVNCLRNGQSTSKQKKTQKNPFSLQSSCCKIRPPENLGNPAIFFVYVSGLFKVFSSWRLVASMWLLLMQSSSYFDK